MSRRFRLFTLQLILPAVLVAAWWLATSGSTNLYFPPLEHILTKFRKIWLFARFGTDVVPSLIQVLMGFAISAALAIPGGLVLGLWPTARHVTAGIVEFMRAIPAAALIPFAVLLFGIGNSMKVFIIVTVCVWPILLNVIDGVTGVAPQFIETARAYHLPAGARLFRVIAPAAMPQTFSGLRVALALDIIMMVISEMFAGTGGIGYFVLQAERTFAVTQMWSGIILLGLFGYVLNLMFVAAERHALWWYRGAQALAE